MNYLLRISLTLGSLCAALPAQLTFSVDFSAQALTDLTSEEQALFTDGLAFWDRIIDGHQDNTDRNWTLFVDTFSQGSMNGGITLGSARPIDLLLTNPVPGSGLSAPWPDRFVIAGNGEASFNTNPEAGPLRSSVIIHEIGHALGIGTLWELNEVYNDGNPDTSSGRTLQGGIPGQYVGAHALAAYQAEFDPGATFIPVELDGGDSTAHGHWNEVTDNFSMENQPGFDSDPGDEGPAPTDSFGNSLDDEILTGVLGNNIFLSETTKASLIDIGFTLEPEMIPEPSSTLLSLLSLLCLTRRRR